LALARLAIDPTAKNDYYSFIGDKLWQHGIHGAKEEG
jgi:hypothetical protein